MRRYQIAVAAVLVAVSILAAVYGVQRYIGIIASYIIQAHAPELVPESRLSPFQQAVATNLRHQIQRNITYQDGYFVGGEPPADIGVCTDVVIRSFRAGGVDLQQAVARDIIARRGAYHIDKPDPNIDHRRCRNLSVFFKQHAGSLPTSGASADWRPGDIVFWDSHRNGVASHVGIIANGRADDGQPAIIHHWPGMPVSETNGLFNLPILYHFRWNP